MMRTRTAGWWSLACAAGAGLALQLLGVPPAGARPVDTGWTTSPTNSQNKTQIVTCGVSDWPLGAGFAIQGGAGQVGLTNLGVSEFGDDMFAVAAEDDDGFAGAWFLDTYQMCHPAPTNWEMRTASSQFGSPQTRSVTATCRPGTRAFSGGAGVTGGSGNIIIDDIRVAPDLTGVTVTGVEDEDGFDGSWGITARVVCGTPFANQHRRQATTASDSQTTKSAVAGCPPGTQAHGAGAELVGAAGQVRIEVMRIDDNNAALVTAREDADGHAGNWSITAYAVCSS